MQQFMSSWNLVSCVAPVSVDVFHHESNEFKSYVFTCHPLSQNLASTKSLVKQNHIPAYQVSQHIPGVGPLKDIVSVKDPASDPGEQQ